MLKIGGKSLHQHLLSSEISPQLNEDSQLEQVFVFIVFMGQRWYLLCFVRIKVDKKNRNCVTFAIIENVNYGIERFKLYAIIQKSKVEFL